MMLEEIQTLAGELFDNVKRYHRLLVTTHVSPDGDAIASLIATAKILEQMGCEAICCLDGEISSHLTFVLGDVEVITTPDKFPTDFDAMVAVDAATVERLGDVGKLINEDTFVFNIDHHGDNPKYGKLNIILPEAASTTEILFHLALSLNLTIDKDLASLLYTGLVTDTGGFRYSNTSARSFQAACQLTQLGAHPNQIAEAVFASNSQSGMKTLAAALANLEVTHEGLIATMWIDLDNGFDEPEDLGEYPLRIRGVLACAYIRRKDGKTRVSLRSRGSVSVSGIAHDHGGGGHSKAAGFRTNEGIESIRLKVIEELRREVDRTSS